MASVFEPEGQGPITIKDNKIVPPLRAEMKRSPGRIATLRLAAVFTRSDGVRGRTQLRAMRHHPL
jgi:hypothetical protein